MLKSTCTVNFFDLNREKNLTLFDLENFKGVYSANPWANIVPGLDTTLCCQRPLAENEYQMTSVGF